MPTIYGQSLGLPACSFVSYLSFPSGLTLKGGQLKRGQGAGRGVQLSKAELEAATSQSPAGKTSSSPQEGLGLHP